MVNDLSKSDGGCEAGCAGGRAPRGLLLQWHVTERCNLRCAHCYQSSPASGGIEESQTELPYADLLDVLAQYEHLLARLRQRAGSTPLRGHVTVTGGEPFVRDDFPRLLETLAARRAKYSFAILTNGSLLDAAMARRLRRLGPSFVQVSLEGAAETHDRIRGDGNFERTVAAIRRLVRAGVRTSISFTASRLNYREFPAVARLGVKLGVAQVWADRLIPEGSGAALASQVLSPDETRAFFTLMHDARRDANRRWRNRTRIAMHRALQFLIAGGRPYRCTAGDSLITIQPNGDVLPCRRLPIRVGNVRERSLAEIYEYDPLLRELRDRRTDPAGCERCLYKRLCSGGLRCLSYALHGDPFVADPGCWHADAAGDGRSGRSSVAVRTAAHGQPRCEPTV